ncbi:MAG TPA: four helix bundle protein [Chromatiales bacterium]|nr:four helix bundle protein [Chromatiales bacterium]
MEAFEHLEVWRRGVGLAKQVYAVADRVPDRALADQLRRSSLSVPSNIAEGYERNTRPEFARFVRLAKGSCGELRTQLILAVVTGQVQEQEVAAILDEARQLSRMLGALLVALTRRSGKPTSMR